MSCGCEDVGDLALDRAAIGGRARTARRMEGRLAELARHPDGEHALLACSTCGALYQRAIAWNWGAKPYLFRVPDIDEGEWLDQPYVDPDELLLFSAGLDQVLGGGELALGSERCREAGCDDVALRLSAFCLAHHLPRIIPFPGGRPFGPYIRMTRESLAEYLATTGPRAGVEAPKRRPWWRRGR